MKRVRWAEGIPERSHISTSNFATIKNLLDNGKTKEVAMLLNSLPPEEAAGIIHEKNGYVVKKIMAIAYSAKMENKYTLPNFSSLYQALVAIDLGYLRKITLELVSKVANYKRYEEILTDINSSNRDSYENRLSNERAAKASNAQSDSKGFEK